MQGVATGRKPTLDGFDSLRSAGYRTVIQLHGAGEDVAATREVAEKRELKFIAIDVSTDKLADAYATFEAAIADRANQPLYVFDADGVRTGAMWYLHFRLTEVMNDDAARIRAKPLGFTDQGDDAKQFMVAIQRLLETR